MSSGQLKLTITHVKYIIHKQKYTNGWRRESMCPSHACEETGHFSVHWTTPITSDRDSSHQERAITEWESSSKRIQGLEFAYAGDQEKAKSSVHVPGRAAITTNKLHHSPTYILEWFPLSPSRSCSSLNVNQRPLYELNWLRTLPLSLTLSSVPWYCVMTCKTASPLNLNSTLTDFLLDYINP